MSLDVDEKLVSSEPMEEMLHVAKCFGPSYEGANKDTLRDEDPALTDRITPDILALDSRK
jgi:hypothetical protein